MRLRLTALLVVPLACGDDGADADATGTATEATASASATESATGTDSASSSAGSSDDGTTEGADTTGGDVDPTPILERTPAISHTCTETRAMTRAEGITYGRTEGLVSIGEQAFALRSTETLTLAEIGLDGTIGEEVVIEPEEFVFRNASATVVDAGVAALWTYYGDESNHQLRWSVIDASLATVVASKDLEGLSGPTITVGATVPTGDGLALFYGVGDVGGDTTLRFVHVDGTGELTGTPVDLAALGDAYGNLSVGAAPATDGGYAVAYVTGELGQGEVAFVVIDADGTPRGEPQRISRPAGDGWRADLGTLPRSNVLAVGDTHWVAFTEAWTDQEAMQGHVVVRLAVVDAAGNTTSHLLQAPEEGRNNLWPTLTPIDDRIALAWTSGTIIWICGGCIADNDLHAVLLDPETIVPASEVVTQLHDMNGIVAPILVPLPGDGGTDVLTASSLDLHAVSLPASGSLRCESAG